MQHSSSIVELSHHSPGWSGGKADKGREGVFGIITFSFGCSEGGKQSVWAHYQKWNHAIMRVENIGSSLSDHQGSRCHRHPRWVLVFPCLCTMAHHISVAGLYEGEEVRNVHQAPAPYVWELPHLIVSPVKRPALELLHGTSCHFEELAGQN